MRPALALLIGLAMCLAAPLGSPLGAAEIGDADRGARLFAHNCTACHQIGEGAKNRVGPRLTGVFGRRAGSVPDFAYSKAMTRMGADGLVWTLETLDPYLDNPKALVTGTRMAYKGLHDATARADLLAYLRDWSDKPRDIPEAEPTARQTDPDRVAAALSPEVLALKGDAEYGAYLSAECQTCHQHDGTDQGIPAITHWPIEDFVLALHAYKQKLRPHPVMQMMAGRLNDEEIAALAAYFATLE